MKTPQNPVLVLLASTLRRVRLRVSSTKITAKLVACIIFGALAGVVSAPAIAQTLPSSSTAVTLPTDSSSAGRSNQTNQTIERIRTEDGSVRIDELRVGGETQSITVQPKGSDGDSASPSLPAYEIRSADGARGSPPDARSGIGAGTSGTSGPRVWNLLKF